MNDRTVPKSSTAAALEDTEPTKNQHLKSRGRTNTPLLKGVLVYDWDQKTVRVESEKDVPREEYHKVKLPSKRKQVTIFVDSETESKPTIRSTTPEGQGNVFLATLYLDHLGRYHRLLHSLGLLPTLYVLNAHKSGISPQVTAQSLGGIGQ